MENFVILVMVFGPIVIGIVGIVAIPVWLIREFAIKSPRRRRWIAAHDGHLIGSDEFFAWCKEEGVDPGYYW